MESEMSGDHPGTRQPDASPGFRVRFARAHLRPGLFPHPDLIGQQGASPKADEKIIHKSGSEWRGFLQFHMDGNDPCRHALIINRDKLATDSAAMDLDPQKGAGRPSVHLVQCKNLPGTS